jgi:hypothetical protein
MDTFTVSEGGAGYIVALFAVITDNDADKTDFDGGFVFLFNRCGKARTLIFLYPEL